MHDASDRRFVDAHAEGDCCNDDSDLAVHKILLNLTPLTVFEPRVVGFAG